MADDMKQGAIANVNGKIFEKQLIPLFEEHGYEVVLFSEYLKKGVSFEQLSKTGNTEFEFENINVILDDNLFIQMSTLNDLRRSALEKLENLVLEKYTRRLNSTSISLPTILENNTAISASSYKSISLLLNILNSDFA